MPHVMLYSDLFQNPSLLSTHPLFTLTILRRLSRFNWTLSDEGGSDTVIRQICEDPG